MGVFEALGVLALLLLTLGFIPATLTLLRPKALGRSGSQNNDYATSFNRPLSNITALILFRRRAVLLVTLAVTLLIGAGAIWLRADTDYLKIFPRDSDTVQSAIKLHERLAGAATVQIVVSDGRARGWDPAELLRAVEALQNFSRQQSGVDAAISVADIVKRLNTAFGDGVVFQPAAEKIPESSQDIEIMIRDFLSQDESIRRLVNPEWSRAVIILRTNLFSSNKLGELTDKIAEWSIINLPPGISAQATGSVVLLNNASDEVAASQSSSLAIALASIYLMMVVLFRSFATAMLALIPNLLPIVCYFGFLGWTGITLDITTSLVASAALGLAVDNAVHMIRRYRQSIAERGRLSEGWVMWLTMLRTGKPTVLANLMLIAAFLVFVFSSFTPVRVAGLLWAVTILACLAADMILLPVLIKSSLFARAAMGKVETGAPQQVGQEYSELQKASSEL
jgi:predicted RND superfamily exporter protein